MTTRGRAKPVRKTGNTRPVVVAGICTPSAAASVGATSCCTAGVEYLPVLTAGPTNISGIATSHVHGEPCMYATSARVMKSPSRGTIRSWPVRPGKYARANISRKRCRVARAVASAGAARWIRGASLPIDRLTCWLDTVQVIATRARVIAIRDPTLRMRALLADYRLFSSALILVPSTRILQAPCNGLVLETLAMPRRRIVANPEVMSIANRLLRSTSGLPVTRSKPWCYSGCECKRLLSID
jgi:hypothetical protein